MRKSSLRSFALALWLLAVAMRPACAQSPPATATRDGGIDRDFLEQAGQGASDRIHAAALSADGSGKVLLAGWFTSYAGQERWRLARIFPDGRLDAAFDPGDGPGTEPILALLPLPDGGCLVAGAFRRFAEKPRRLLARLRADGSLDENFNATRALALPPPAPTRRNRDPRSRLGDSYGPPAAVQKPVDGLRALLFLPPHQVLVAGEFADGVGHLLCLDVETGAANPDFHPPEIPAGGVINALALQPDGKILIGGQFDTVAGQRRVRVARLEADGTLDRTFDPGLGPDENVHCLALTADGKVLVGGEFTQFAGQQRAYLARLDQTGQLDPDFVPELAGDGSRSVDFLLPCKDGALLVGGRFATINHRPLGGVVRLNAAGKFDPTFDPGVGAQNFPAEDPGEEDDDPPGVHALVPLPDAHGEPGLLVAGRFELFNATPAHNLVRLRLAHSVP